MSRALRTRLPCRTVPFTERLLGHQVEPTGVSSPKVKSPLVKEPALDLRKGWPEHPQKSGNYHSMPFFDSPHVTARMDPQHLVRHFASSGPHSV